MFPSSFVQRIAWHFAAYNHRHDLTLTGMVFLPTDRMESHIGNAIDAVSAKIALIDPAIMFDHGGDENNTAWEVIMLERKGPVAVNEAVC